MRQSVSPEWLRNEPADGSIHAGHNVYEYIL